ncbi:hypothetical protein XANCAGTX0491_001462 [Xanthoria calcicola]
MPGSGTLLTLLLVLIFIGLLVSQDAVTPKFSVSPAKFSGWAEDCDPSKAGILPQINLNGLNVIYNFLTFTQLRLNNLQPKPIIQLLSTFSLPI